MSVNKFERITQKEVKMKHFIILLFLATSVFCQPAWAVVSTLVADAKTGTVFSAHNSLRKQYPASLTKVMTLYLTFNALDKGLLKMDDVLPVSLNAAKQPRSKLGLKAGDTIRVKEAVMALIIKSANDVAVVLSEALASNEEAFAQMMTQTAHKLGMKDTYFKNASGLHHPEQVTTAQDMALLTMAMINHHPQYYKLFSAKSFWYKGKEHKTHNQVTLNYDGAEGLKTGYIAAVGYNIISTAKRDDNRLIAVVIGQTNSKKRDNQAVNLLNRGFNSVQKSKSVLKKLKKQGKQLSLDKSKLTDKPNLSPQIKTMEKYLAIAKKQATEIQQNRLEKYEKTGILANLSSPVNVLSDNISQGDTVENVSMNTIKTIAQSDSETLEEKMSLANEALETTQVGGMNLLHKDNIVLTKDTLNDEEILAIASDLEKKETNAKNYSSTKKIVSALTLSAEQTDRSELNPIIKERNQSVGYDETVKKIKIDLKQQNWSVQVGAFREKAAAQKQADKAYKFVRSGNTTVQITRKDNIYRSRIYGFKNKKEAMQACRKLKNKNINCLPLAPVS